MMELKRIPSFLNYSITKDGKVWSHKRTKAKGGWLKPSLNRGGYWFVNLLGQGSQRSKRIHRLVLETYIGSCPQGMECRHLNGIRQDNRLENLKWGTRSENRQDSTRHGTHGKPWLGKFGESHPSSKLSNKNKQLVNG